MVVSRLAVPTAHHSTLRLLSHLPATFHPSTTDATGRLLPHRRVTLRWAIFRLQTSLPLLPPRLHISHPLATHLNCLPAACPTLVIYQHKPLETATLSQAITPHHHPTQAHPLIKMARALLPSLLHLKQGEWPNGSEDRSGGSVIWKPCLHHDEQESSYAEHVGFTQCHPPTHFTTRSCETTCCA